MILDFFLFQLYSTNFICGRLKEHCVTWYYKRYKLLEEIRWLKHK